MFGRQLAALEGRVRHCIRYTKKSGKKRCAKFSAGPGNPRGRRKVGITRKFRETSTTKRRAKRVCARKKLINGVKRCISWRYISAKLSAKRRPGGKKRSCSKWGKSKVGKKVCRKYIGSIRRKKSGKKRIVGPMSVFRKAAKLHSKTMGGFSGFGASRRTKRRCVRFGRGKSGRKVCRKWSR
jgi:hypothetical protein